MSNFHNPLPRPLPKKTRRVRKPAVRKPAVRKPAPRQADRRH